MKYLQGFTAMFLLFAATTGCGEAPNPTQPNTVGSANVTLLPAADTPTPQSNATASADPAASSDPAKTSSETAAAQSDQAPEAKPDAKSDKPDDADKPRKASAVFAGGCFWCVEAVFEELEGVHEAVSGYAGGKKETANYDMVKLGVTKHAEAVEIIYDPDKISYDKLLAVHFATHDPTTLNRQGADVGPQYRSTIFYANEKEKAAAEATIKRLAEAGAFGTKPIVTTLEPLIKFYKAEHYHQNYACDNPYNQYIQYVAMPKVEKVRKLFKDHLKKDGSPLDKAKQ